MNCSIVVVDDDAMLCRVIEKYLASRGFDVEVFTDPVKAIKYLQDHSVSLCLFDVCLKNNTGIDLYKYMRESGMLTPVIFMSGRASLSQAAECMKLGAYDLLEKPFTEEYLLHVVEQCVESLKLHQRLIKIKEGEAKLLGDHPSMHVLRSQISRVAGVDSVILIHGESGTGKELVAHEVHKQSQRFGEAFIKVNCSAIPDSLHESALFGHQKGAFTGATCNKQGYFEAAQHGTLFLDEIADLSLLTQSSLLRVLGSQEIQKVGSNQTTKVDVRVIAASHKDLKTEVAEGRFREDLFYRLNVIPVALPALRDRSSDIPLLSKHVIQTICSRYGMSAKHIENEVLSILKTYSWPGNVRELINILERMIIMSEKTITITDIPREIAKSRPMLEIKEETLSLKEFRQKAERQYLQHQLKVYKGNVTQLAKVLGMDRVNLHKKLASYNIKREQSFLSTH